MRAKLYRTARAYWKFRPRRWRPYHAFDDPACHTGGRRRAEQLAEAELEPEPEHQEDHAELGERADDLRIRDQRDREVRADDEAREDVAEHDGLPQPLEDQGGHRGDAEDDRQGRQERLRIGHDTPRCAIDPG